MEERTNINEYCKECIKKIENELTLIQSFNKIYKENEENQDFLVFCNQTLLGNDIKENIEEMSDIISKIYEITHDLSQNTMNHLNNTN